MTAYFHNGVLLFDNGAIATSESCCCGGGVDLCLGATPSAWKVMLTVSFESCTPPTGYNNCTAMDTVSGQCSYLSGNFTTGAFYQYDLSAGATPKYGCDNTNGYWSTFGFRVLVQCPAGITQGRILLSVGTTNSALSTAYAWTAASITGLAEIETDTTYILTPLTNDPGTGFRNPCIPTSVSLVITAV